MSEHKEMTSEELIKWGLSTKDARNDIELSHGIRLLAQRLEEARKAMEGCVKIHRDLNRGHRLREHDCEEALTKELWK